jgi:hypothetical protein
VDVRAEQVLLHLLEDSPDGVYSFVCPACREDVEKRADQRIVSLLISAGVATGDRRPHPNAIGPAEPDPRGSLPEAPPFTWDDLIELHFLLEDDRFLEELLSGSA